MTNTRTFWDNNRFGSRNYNSYFSRCLMMASMLSNDQSTNWLSSGMSVFPRFVSLYSTRGGTSG